MHNSAFTCVALCRLIHHLWHRYSKLNKKKIQNADAAFIWILTFVSLLRKTLTPSPHPSHFFLSPPSFCTPLAITPPSDVSSTSSFCLNKSLHKFTQAQSNKTEGPWLKLAKWPCGLCLCRNVGRDQLDWEMATLLLCLSPHLAWKWNASVIIMSSVKPWALPETVLGGEMKRKWNWKKAQSEMRTWWLLQH